MAQWTSDQQAAIDSRGANLLVSAAAGSGKTAVLVERIINLMIQDQVPIDQMLIVTFTNAAASEMRERIVEALYSGLDKDESDFLNTQIRNIQNANIMTLHSFCIGVIRNHAHCIDLDPGFKVGDSVSLDLLVKEALDMTLEDFYQDKSQGFIDFVEAYSENRTDDKLSQLILDVYKFIQSQPDPLVWLKEVQGNLLEPDVYKEHLMAYIDFNLSRCQEVLDMALVWTEASDGPEEYHDMILEGHQQVETLKELLGTDLEAMIVYLRGLSHSRLKAIKKDRKEEINPLLLGEVKELRDQYKALIKDLKTFFEHKTWADYRADTIAVEPMMATLYDLVEAFSHHYGALKVDKNMVDFNDLEHMALRALDHKAVQDHYRHKFSYIFLDEYQDSNLVQETLIDKVKGKDNVFLVGDVKQSIYRFRLADPSLFMSKYHSYKKEAGHENRRIDLKKNFRSRKDILEGINFIFENLMSEAFGEMTYDADARLYAGLEFKDIEGPEIQVKIIENPKSDDLEGLTNAELEAHAAVKTIKALVGKKSYNRKTDTYFDIDYKHVVILMRAVSAWAPVFNEVFLEEGIPLFADHQSGYFETLEIKMFVDLLKIVDNPRQDLALLTVMRAPIFSFTTEDLIAIRTHTPTGSFYDSLEAYDVQGACLDKIMAMNEALADWREKMLYMALDGLLWHIMSSTGFYQYVAAMPGGEGRQGNLRLLVDRAKAYKGVATGLFHFLQMIDNMKSASSDMGTAKIIGEQDNVVRLMSIHKSKGLEFPVVILSGMNKKFNLRDAYQEVLVHKHLGLGPRIVNLEDRVYFDSLPKKLIKHQIKFESLAEEMRILYVALTRAVDRLIMIGQVKDITTATTKWLRGCNRHQLTLGQSYLDWVMAVLSTHPASKGLHEGIDKPYMGLKTHGTQWCIEVLDKADLTAKKVQLQKDLSEIFNDLSPYEDVHIQERLEEAFGYKYPYDLASKLPSKFSVSELKVLQQMALEDLGYKSEPLNRMPKFLMETQKRTKAEVGTLMHYVMQKLDRRLDVSIGDQIDKMVQKAWLDQEDLKDIDQEGLALFFASDLGQRYQAAGHVEKEKAFVLKQGLGQVIESTNTEDSLLIQGIIDCYFIEEDGIVLVDYKTDYIYGEEKILEDRYQKQLSLYKAAIESMTSYRVKETYIYSFYKNKAIPVNI